MKYVTEWSSEIIIVNQFILDFYRDGQEGLLSIILQRAPEDTSPPPLIPLCAIAHASGYIV
jgi:hypothetical protein